MKSALECNPHSNVIRNFWEKKKRNPRIVFELIRYIPRRKKGHEHESTKDTRFKVEGGGRKPLSYDLEFEHK